MSTTTITTTSKSNGTNGVAGSSIKITNTTSVSTSLKIAECALGLSVPLWSTLALQANTPSCRVSRLIASTTVFYGILYGILWQWKGLLQPPLSSWLSKVETTQDNVKINKSATSRAASEWRSRLLAIANALVLTYGSLLCFNEWPTYHPESEGWVKTVTIATNNSNNSDGFNCFSSHPVTFASLFVGYLQWDLCWLIWHRRTHFDPGSMIHHSIFIAVCHFVLRGTYFRKPFAWLSLTEISTPFLHLRWLLAATGRKGDNNNSNKYESSLYFGVSLGFAVTFLSTRTVGYGLGLLDLWLSYDFWKEIGGLWGVVVGLHLAYGLNLFWSFKVSSALARTLSSSKKKTKED